MTDREDILRMVRDAREQTMKELPPNTFDLDLFHERFFKTAYEAGATAEREKVAAWMRQRDEWARDRLARHGIPMPGDDNGRDPV